MKLNYQGPVTSSKSVMNRALLLSTYNSGAQILGLSEADDVKHMLKFVSDLQNGATEFDCGEGGTTFRFALTRLSRLEGEFRLKGTPRLLSRPHEELIEALKALGVLIEKHGDHFLIRSKGWQEPSAGVVEVSSERSSQFASSLLLNAWGLPFDLRLKLSEKRASEGYFVMSLILAQHFGMVVQQLNERELLIPKNQQVQSKVYGVESDMSSCFVLAAGAMLGGDVQMSPFPERSIQPDRSFVPILQSMGGRLFFDGQSLRVLETANIRAIEVDLSNTPDLFPVLSVLAGRANGTSLLSGLTTLEHKESDRLKNTMDLLKALKRDTKLEDGVLHVFGNPKPYELSAEMSPDQDHRMAMAMQVANWGGATIQIQNPEVVNKSFPEFWKIVRGESID